jgi:lipoprotein-anchoring transpeptidase ErfK/SrfK
MGADSDHLVKSARRAIEQNRPRDARSLLQQAARQSPDDPRIWLLLAGIASSPRAREAYLQRAAELRESNSAAVPIGPAAAVSPSSPQAASPAVHRVLPFLFAALLLLAGIFLWSYLAGRPVTSLVAAWLPGVSLSQEAENAAVESTAPTPTPNDVAPRSGPAAVQKEVPDSLPPTPTLAAVAAETPQATTESSPADPEEVVAVVDAPLGDPLVKQIAPDSRPRAAWTPTLAPTSTPQPTATPEPVEQAAASGARPAGVGATERWVDVNLTTQTLVAYEGDTPVLTSLISSGTWLHPTVTGQYRTYMKYESQTMNGYLLGYDYYLEGVPYVMYFYRDYAIHGTYWHNNFGTPMSHGCVNMNTADAGWLYNWAPIGTVVNVHH